MKTRFIILFILWTTPTLHAEQILMAKGQTTSIQAARGNVFNSDSRVLKVRANGAHLLLLAKKEGQVQVVIGKKTYEVVVVKPKTMQSYQQIRSLIQKNLGLKLKVVENRVTLYGELLRFADWINLIEQAKENNWEYSFQAKINEDLQQKTITLLTKEFNQHLLPNPNLSFAPEARALVSKEQKNSLALYKQILMPYGFDVSINENSLSIEPVIGVKILVTEMRKKFFQRLGMKWPSSYATQIIPSAPSVSGGVSLEALEENGLAKILASPHLICRSGKEAHFLAGGEIPIKIISQKMADVIWKKYGILLNVKPKADRGGRMSIEISTEVSTIDTSQTIDGIPGFLTNRIDTHFDLSQSQTIVLSGLLKNEEGNSKEGLPFLTRIPILGALFSSQEYRNQETELVIMVTPKVLNTNGLIKDNESE